MFVPPAYGLIYEETVCTSNVGWLEKATDCTSKVGMTLCKRFRWAVTMYVEWLVEYL